MDEELRTAMRDFCIRVLEGTNCSPQETATLPAIMKLLLESKNAISGN